MQGEGANPISSLSSAGWGGFQQTWRSARRANLGPSLTPMPPAEASDMATRARPRLGAPPYRQAQDLLVPHVLVSLVQQASHVTQQRLQGRDDVTVGRLHAMDRGLVGSVAGSNDLAGVANRGV
jgi:hypothetical protein